MDTDKINELLGSLVKAKIVARCSANSALGKYGDERLLVTNGADYVGLDCLVKIDSNPKSLERGLIGNFITSNIPSDFQDSSYLEYVLTAFWEDRMKKRERYPAIDEINRYFDPGNLTQAFYVSPGVGKDRSIRTHIFSGGHHTSKFSIKKMVDTLTNRGRTRLIIAETDFIMNSIYCNIAEMGIKPILMQALR